MNKYAMLGAIPRKPVARLDQAHMQAMNANMNDGAIDPTYPMLGAAAANIGGKVISGLGGKGVQLYNESRLADIAGTNYAERAGLNTLEKFAKGNKGNKFTFGKMKQEIADDAARMHTQALADNWNHVSNVVKGLDRVNTGITNGARAYGMTRSR